MGKIRRLLDEDGVVWQIGELGKVDAGGGGTVAKLIANLDVDTVDLGVPVLSMHAPFELVSKLDTDNDTKEQIRSFIEAKNYPALNDLLDSIHKLLSWLNKPFP